jgi:hypothetical protein
MFDRQSQESGFNFKRSTRAPERFGKAYNVGEEWYCGGEIHGK